MLTSVFLLGLIAQQTTPPPNGNSERQPERPVELSIARCLAASDSADQKVEPRPLISPGLPPLFSFRYYEGKMHGRFSNSDLMLDDAGH